MPDRTNLARESIGPPRVYCAIAQPAEGGVPVTAITTVHKDDYDDLLAEFDLVRAQRFAYRAVLLSIVDLYRADDGGVYVTRGASPADDALADALEVLYPEGNRV